MIALLFALAFAWPGQDPTPIDPAVVDHAAVEYAAGRYDAASAAYAARLDDDDVARADLAFNLGACAYRLGRFAEAALWFRRAGLVTPRDPALAFNLALTDARLGVDNTPTTPTDIARALAAAFTDGELLALTAGLQTLGLAGFALRRRFGARLVASALLGLGLLAATPLVLRAAGLAAPDGVVLAQDLALHGAPDDSSIVQTHLGGGELVRVRERTDAWLRVEHPRGAGWVRRTDVGLIE